MNPDKLFDYLDGKLAPAERTQLEERLMTDEQLRRQFNIAREIHRGGGTSREVIVPEDVERGARLGRRILIAAIVLVFLNVAAGLGFITFKSKKKSDTKSGEEAVRRQLTPAISAAAENALPLPTIANEIHLTAPRTEWETLAARVLTAATRFGGTARQEVLDKNTLAVVVDIPSARETEFRLFVTSGSETPGLSTGPVEPGRRTYLQVRIAEAAP